MGHQKLFPWMLVIHAALLQESGTQELRLVNGWNRCAGRLEVYFKGIWGTVCDDYFNPINAQIVCRQLACGNATKVVGWAYFGQGSGNISLDDVKCTGSEPTIWDCAHAGWFNNDCGHNEDVGVVCSDAALLPTGSTEISTPTPFATSKDLSTTSIDLTTQEIRDSTYFPTKKSFETTHPATEKETTMRTVEMSYKTTTSSKTTHSITQKEETVMPGLAATSQTTIEELKTSAPTSVIEKSLRLVNGEDKCRGRIEVFYNGKWGTICDDGWDMNDTQVVCKQLACGEALQALPNAAFGEGTGSIFLDQVQCKGNESSLEECSHKPWGVHDCRHKEDAGVICSGPVVTTSPPDLSTSSAKLTTQGIREKSLRLVNGEDKCRGRVEVFYNGSWGTICDDGWDMNDTQVVCKQLACGEALQAVPNAAFGEGTGSIFLDQVQCKGNESSLEECSHKPWGVHDCRHKEDAGVICSGPAVTTSPPGLSTSSAMLTTQGIREKSLRLVNGEDKCHGRIEVFYNGSWGTICDDGWDMNDAQVVCKQLACGEALQALPNAAFGEGTGSIFLDQVQCEGNESSLEECSHKPWGVHDCRHKEDAGVVCSGLAVTTPTPGPAHTTPPPDISTTSADLTTQGIREKSLRLVNGEDKCRGRIEVFYNGTWGTICDDGWDMNDAQVVCRQLACGEAVQALLNAAFGEGTGSIFLDELKCKGNESSLEECSHKPWGVHDCRHKEDAGVICSGPAVTTPPSELSTTSADLTTQKIREKSLRLVNGEDKCRGRIEVFYNGSWGTICDDGWDMNDAQVVCKQLACGAAVQALPNAAFGEGTGSIFLDELKCKGNESSLEECSHKPWGVHDCRHKEDAGVICSGPAVTTPTPDFSTTPTDMTTQETRAPTKITSKVPEKSLRVVNGEDKCRGRVEVFYNGTWGTICDDGWDMNDAQVVCKQLACGVAVQALPNAAFGEGTGSIFLDELKCKGNESSLEECSHKPWGIHNCRHKEDAGVICSGPAVTTPPPDLSTTSMDLTTQGIREKSLRLVNGEDKCHGRVEVFYNGTWGTICDDGWDMNDAQVVCKQLACGAAVQALPNAAFGEGTGSIFLDELKCKGNESSLEECSHKPWGIHNCRHKEDAGVICSGPAITTSAPKSALVTTTSSLTVRLMNGKNRCQGRLEIFHNGNWGTVCDDGWDLPDAKVVCKQLACGEAMEATNEAYFGQGTGNILLENVQCKGNESSIEECSNSGWGTHQCDHKEDAGVICSETVSLTTKNPLILTPSRNTTKVPVGALTTQNPTTRPVPAVTTPHPIIPASKSIAFPNTQKPTPSGKCLYGCKFTGPSGSFSSPFYPSNYPKNSYCVWEIEVEERRHVELRFEDFRVEITRFCTVDFVEIFDGPFSTSPSFGKICWSPRKRYISSSNKMRIVFISDSSMSERGFLAHYREVPPRKTVIPTLLPPPPPTTAVATIATLPDDTTDFVTLSCYTEYMKAVIGKQYLISKGCLDCNLYISDATCTADISKDKITFYIPYDGCGTKRENYGKISTFTSIVSSTGNGVNPQFRFICKMEPSKNMEVTHNIDEFECTNQGPRFHMEFLFYESPFFKQPINNMGYFMNLNQNAYIQATLYSFDRNLILFMDSCVASPNRYDFTTETYVMINRGCKMDSTYQLFSSRNRRNISFRFKSFTLRNNYSTVYIRCNILVCKALDYSSRCYQGCYKNNRITWK